MSICLAARRRHATGSACGDELLLRAPSQHAEQLGIGRNREHGFVVPTDEATRIRARTAVNSGPSTEGAEHGARAHHE